MLFKRLTGALCALFVSLSSCSSEVAVDSFTLRVTSDAPTSGDPLSSMRLLFIDGTQRYPADANDGQTNLPLVLANPVVESVLVSIPYGGSTFTSGSVTLHATGLVGSTAATQFVGTINLDANTIIDIHLEALSDECDADADGFADCSVAGCCSSDAEALSDCEPNEPTANPWAVEDSCEPCSDTIDQNCDGQDAPCIDEDGDGIPDCEEVLAGCGAGEPTVAPGLPELCDGIDNNCDGVTDEGFFLVEAGTILVSGDACGQGQCAGGVVQCLDAQTVQCSTNASADPIEDCTDEIDNNCNGVVNEGCEADDADGDGFDPSEGDCNDYDSAFNPNAVEGCCPLTLQGLPNALELCDRNCDGATTDCAADDLDGDGFGADDCADDDPLTYPGAAEKCGDGIDQDCFAGDAACGSGFVDEDGDGWSPPDDCNDADPTINPEGEEACDGVDNNCNGSIDDGNPETQDSAPCGSDVGLCTFGSKVCVNSGGFVGQVFCLGGQGPAADICDGADNDCDGTVDQDFLPGAVSSYTDFDGTTGLGLGDSCGAGVCNGGTVVCGAGGAELICSSGDLASADVCDGLDNDCDGDADEAYSAGGTVVLTDLDGTTGLVLGDSCGTGFCSGGVVECSADESTLSCSTHGNSNADVCDGLDNDCDGTTDEDYSAGGSSTYTDLDGTTGLVKGDACGVGACAGGSVVCTGDNQGLTCSNASQASIEVCDGIDNDCDGLTDEDFKTGGSVTLTDLNGTSGLALDDSCGVGACAGGTVQCAADGLALVCSTHSAATADSCDGADNDCDGAADEDFVTGGTVTFTDLDGTANLVKGATCGVGACAGGGVVCSSDGNSLVCDSHGSASADLCDDQDNDCDGSTDEDYKAGGTVTYTDLDGTTDLVLGGSCGTGDCTGGAVICAPGGGALTCSTASSASPEVCDDADNDCDGTADEDYVTGGSVTFTDLDGTVGLVKGDSCGAGVCGGGTVVCNSGAGTMRCSTDNLVATDVCDGSDNDCDGIVDNDYISGGPTTFTDWDGSAKSKGAECGTGSCAGGSVVCATTTSLGCSSASSSSADVCDAVDNDCDGVTDEDYIAGGSVSYDDPGGATDLVKGQGCGVGVCQGGTVVCGSTTTLTCSTASNIATDTCDGADNDCDGTTDEDYIAGGSVTYDDLGGATGLVKGEGCGVGACEGGTVVCGSTTSLTCSTLGSVATDTCDGADNDCDGTTDEDYITGGSVTYDDLGGATGLVKGEGCGVGACEGGTVVCGSTTSLTCSTLGSVATDTCDGADNDCDGTTDEDYITGGSVTYDDLGGATGLVKGEGCGVGACEGGTVVCGSTTSLTCSTAASAAATDTCDGADNDCDGTTDEDYITGGSVTYDDLGGATGLVKGEGCGVGACSGGTVVCASTTSLTCSTLGSVATDTCDGADNDCDGTTDEDYITGGSVSYDDPGGATGLVKGEGCGVGACEGGTVVCGSTTSLTCSTAASAAATDTCDGADNDCDGTIDEDYITGGSVTYDDPGGATGLVKGEGCGVGACSGGTVVCGSTTSLTCSTAASAAADDTTCDDTDDDCDGSIDEDVGVLSGAALAADDGKSKGEGCGAGACAGGVVECQSGSLVCSGDSNAAGGADLCDAVDSDCDGTTDEDVNAFTDWDGDVLGLGEPCGTGACDGGQVVCSSDDSSRVCSTAGSASNDDATSCDEVDNDCDGLTDEDVPDFKDFDGSGRLKGQPCGTGACSGGVVQCNASDDALECSTGAAVTVDDDCDDVDDDCDGSTDEHFTGTYDDLGTSRSKGEGCGTGACSGGVVECLNASTLTCSTAGNSSAESTGGCDDIDNDCDGATDEGVVLTSPADDTELASEGCLLAGQCSTGVTATCTGGAYVCDYSGVTDYESGVETLCDNKDNDCDGTIDDPSVDLAMPGDSAGLLAAGCDVAGVCGTGTAATCTAGVWTCDYSSVTNYEPGDESSCDNSDNDCDGQIDEQIVLSVPDDAAAMQAEGCTVVGACTTGAIATCSAGTFTCDYSSVPSYAATEGDTLCDDIDNDCDGTTDEAFGSGGSVTVSGALDSNDDGKIKGADCGTGLCANGVVVCGTASTLVCSTESQAGTDDASSCDDLDNDCDGATDEAFGSGGSVTVSGALDSNDDGKIKGADCGTGLCANGVVVCGTASTLVCSTESQAGADDASSCDDLDNDCDGATDEAFGSGGSVTVSGALDSNDDGKIKGADCGTGLCANGVVVCGTASTLVCSTESQAGTDDASSCDDLDNDCDGTTDEAFGSGGSVTVSGALDSNDDGKIKGADCGTGLCANGVVVCGTASTLVCSTESQAGVDDASSCDDLDNDCDGTTDEAFGSGGSVTVSGALDSNDDGKIKGADCGTGLCANGVVVCGTASTLVCSSNGAAGTDDASSCDGVDNDCDGEVDEAFGSGGSVTTTGQPHAPDDGLFLGESCGVGPCDGGLVVCDTSTTLTCSGLVNADAEFCDGIDNDCNDVTDDVGAGEQEFELCDGFENDCDGEIDEDCQTATPGDACVSDAGEAMNYCMTCANDADCGGAFVCITEGSDNYCALGCSQPSDCHAAPLDTDWDCVTTNGGASQVCAKTCTVANQATDCPWPGWGTCDGTDGFCKPDGT